MREEHPIDEQATQQPPDEPTTNVPDAPAPVGRAPHECGPQADDWLPDEVAALDIEESVGMDSPTVEHPAG
jgi:hypothetical protein